MAECERERTYRQSRHFVVKKRICLYRMTNQLSEEKRRRKSLVNLPNDFEVGEEIYPSEKLSSSKHINSAIERYNCLKVRSLVKE